jgi:hypothetical protein
MGRELLRSVLKLETLMSPFLREIAANRSVAVKRPLGSLAEWPLGTNCWSAPVPFTRFKDYKSDACDFVFISWTRPHFLGHWTTGESAHHDSGGRFSIAVAVSLLAAPN